MTSRLSCTFLNSEVKLSIIRTEHIIKLNYSTTSSVRTHTSAHCTSRVCKQQQHTECTNTLTHTGVGTSHTHTHTTSVCEGRGESSPPSSSISHQTHTHTHTSRVRGRHTVVRQVMSLLSWRRPGQAGGWLRAADGGRSCLRCSPPSPPPLLHFPRLFVSLSPRLGEMIFFFFTHSHFSTITHTRTHTHVTVTHTQSDAGLRVNTALNARRLN